MLFAVTCLAIAFAAGLPGLAAGQDITTEQPNILMIVGDDLGEET